MIEVRNPRLLAKQLMPGTTKLKEAGRLNPLKLSAVINLDTLSTVDITIAENDLSLAMHDFVEAYNASGSIGIYRVVNRGRKIRNSRSYKLNHAFDMLNDCVIAGTSTISGTVAEVIRTLLTHQKEKIGNQFYWQIGTVELSVQYKFDNSYNNVYEELQNITDKYPDYYYSFNFDTFPWTLNLLHKSQIEHGVLRLERNIDNIDIEESDENQCTRLYLSIDSRDDSDVPTAQQGITYRTIEAPNDVIAQFGIIEKPEGIETAEVGSTETEITAWIDQYMAEHSLPELTITITGEDYSQITGEPIDSIICGRKCKTILAEYSVVFHERVVSINYTDLKRNPLHFVASLANKRKSTGGIISNIKKTARRSSKKTNKKVEGLGHLIEETDSYWRSTYWDTINSLRGTIEQTAEHWSATYEDFANCLRGEVRQTASYWRSTYEDFSNSLRGVVEQTARYWRSTYEDFSNSLRGEVEQTASYWRSTYEDFENSTRTIVEQSNSYWRTALSAVMKNGKVTAASIATAINAQGAAGVKLSGDWVEIASTSGSGVNLNDVFTVTDGYIHAKVSVYANPGTVFNGDHVGSFYYSQQEQGHSVHYGILKKAAVDGNTLKIWKFGDADGSPSITFSKATAVSGSWSGMTYNVTATQTNSGTTTTVATGQTSVHFKVDGSGAIAYVKICKDSPTDVNQLGMSELKMEEVASGKRVKLSLKVVSEGSTSWVEKASVSTATTYNNGWDYGLTRRVRTADDATSQETTVKSLSFGQRWTIKDTYTKSNGTTDVVKYTVAAPSRPADPTITAQWRQDNPSSSANPYNKYVILRDGNTLSNLSITVTAGASISYNSSTHKYTATGTASAGGSQRGSATATSGTEAYNAGVDSGFSNGVASSWFVYTQSTYNDQGQLAANSRLAIGYTDGSGSWHTRATWSTPGGGGGGGGAIESIVDVYPVDDNDVQISQDTTISSAINIRACATYTTSDSQILQYRYGSHRVKITPSKGTRFRLECTEKTRVNPSSNLYNYMFKLYSAGDSFSVGTTYDFYH